MILTKEIIKRNGCVKMVDGSFAAGRGITNPSITKYKDKVLLSFRSCDYTFVGYDKKISYGNAFMWYPVNLNEVPAKFTSDNYICELTDDMELINHKRFLEPETKNNLFNGYEDIRLVVWNGTLHAFASVSNGQTIPIAACALDDEYNIVKKFEYGIDGIEKNWMPICDTPRKLFYKCPTETITLDNGSYTIGKTNAKDDTFYKGSTQLVNYKNGYLCIVHTNTSEELRGMTSYRYHHQFLYMDRKLNIVAMSKPFSFMGFPIEFTCGMHIENGRVILPFSAFDCISFISTFNVEVVDELLFGKKNGLIKENSTPLETLIENGSEDELPLLIAKYIVANEKSNYAARICFNTYIGAEAKSKSVKRNAYIDALLDVKKFDIRQANGYLHMLILEDRLIDQINSL